MISGEQNLPLWQYIPSGPYLDRAEFFEKLKSDHLADPKSLYYAIKSQHDGSIVGMIALLNVVPQHRTLEIGYIMFSPRMQRTTAGTDAIYLLLHTAIDKFGYRRVEWKCNSLNAASHRAAQRYGFTFEGTFRQHYIVRGRNRDTCWYSILDHEWPSLRSAFQAWLSPNNFTDDGKQIKSLTELRS